MVAAGKPPREQPLVIAHRGASGQLPEHTLAAYARGARDGADSIETDVVATADGVLVARHEHEISRTTDVAARPGLAHLRTTKLVAGRQLTGWFTEDLTLAQLRSLRAVERLPHLRPDNVAHDGRWRVPTLAEVLGLRAELSVELGREVGVYIETKTPSHFASLGHQLEDLVAAELAAAGLDRPGAPVHLESFEPRSMVRWRRCGVAGTRVLLTRLGAPAERAGAGGRAGGDVLGPAGLEQVAREADGVGPHKRQLFERCDDGTLAEPTSVVADAHAAGLLVHAWTFRAENAFLPPELQQGEDPAAHGDLVAEVRRYVEAGVDGLFTDHPGLVHGALTSD